MSHQHGHAHSRSATSPRRLFAAMALNFGITGVELAGGLASGSLSLTSDAIHNFSDGVSLVVTYLALRWSRLEKTHRFTFGLKRAQILAAVINGSVLVAISAYLLKEAYERFSSPEPIAAPLMAGVAAVGLVANIVGTLLLREGARENLNIRSSYLHLLSDVFSSAAVILGAGAIYWFRTYWVDSLLTALIALYVLKESFEIIKEATSVLLLCVPGSVSLPRIQRDLEALPGVLNLHHVHLWCVDERDTHFEAHVEVDDMPVSRTQELVNAIEERLFHGHGINHVTVQFEVDRCASKALV